MAEAKALGGCVECIRTGRSAAKGAAGSASRVGGRVGVMGLMGGRAGDAEREQRGGVCDGGCDAPAAALEEEEGAAAAAGAVVPLAAADVDDAGAGAFDVRGEMESVCIVRPGIMGEAASGSRQFALVLLLLTVVVWC